MKDPGHYALLHANGVRFSDIVEMIRQEVRDEKEEACPGVESWEGEGGAAPDGHRTKS